MKLYVFKEEMKYKKNQTDAQALIMAFHYLSFPNSDQKKNARVTEKNCRH